MNRRCVVLLGLLLAWTAVPAQAGPAVTFDFTFAAVDIRPGVTADLHVREFVNASQPCRGRVALAVHGMLHTANTWDRLIEALFEENPAGRRMCRVIALDMPGHGGSGLPVGIQFGELEIPDYVSALLGTLDRLADLRISPDTVFGHSLGGLVVQAAQQRLLEQGTNLRRAYGIKNVVLFASAAPLELPLSNYEYLAAAMAPFITWSPTLGAHLALPDSVWATMLFTNFFMQLVSGAPTPADVAARGYNAPAPLAVATGGISVAPGVFATAHKTALGMVAYEHDPAVLPFESAALYSYLTGDLTGSGLALLTGPETVHEMHISNPGLLLDSIAGIIRLP
jgi:pimeloyl-ACP methyl ester carboxylesterase